MPPATSLRTECGARRYIHKCAVVRRPSGSRTRSARPGCAWSLSTDDSRESTQSQLAVLYSEWVRSRGTGARDQSRGCPVCPHRHRTRFESEYDRHWAQWLAFAVTTCQGMAWAHWTVCVVCECTVVGHTYGTMLRAQATTRHTDFIGLCSLHYIPHRAGTHFHSTPRRGPCCSAERVAHGYLGYLYRAVCVLHTAVGQLWCTVLRWYTMFVTSHSALTSHACRSGTSWRAQDATLGPIDRAAARCTTSCECSQSGISTAHCVPCSAAQQR